MLFDKVKRNLRVTVDVFDDDIKDLIEAAKKDLDLADIKKTNEDDPLINRAINLYCKAHFYLDNKDFDRYMKSYDLLKQHLSLAGDYSYE